MQNNVEHPLSYYNEVSKPIEIFTVHNKTRLFLLLFVLFIISYVLLKKIKNKIFHIVNKSDMSQHIFSPKESLTQFIKNIVNGIIAPFGDFFNEIIHLFTDIINSIRNIHEIFNYMQESIDSFLEDIYEILYNYATKLSMLINKVFVLFQKVFFVFEDIFFTIAHTIYTVAAIWNGPLGGGLRTTGKVAGTVGKVFKPLGKGIKAIGGFFKKKK